MQGFRSLVEVALVVVPMQDRLHLHSAVLVQVVLLDEVVALEPLDLPSESATFGFAVAVAAVEV